MPTPRICRCSTTCSVSPTPTCRCPNRSGRPAAPVESVDERDDSCAHPADSLRHRRVHWIDAVSESMLADFLARDPATPAIALITSRPEYEGALTRVHGAQAIALAPLGDSDTAALLGELLGPIPRSMSWRRSSPRPPGIHSSPRRWVRELAQRGVLGGHRGDYVCRTDIADVPSRPRCRRPSRRASTGSPPTAKRTLNAAAVIGGGFDAEFLTALGVEPAFDELVRRRTDRPGAVHAAGGICVPASADPRGRLRISAEIRSLRLASAPCGGDPSARTRIGRGQCGSDRRTSARPPVTGMTHMPGICAPADGPLPRHLRGAGQLGTCSPDSRRVARR